MGGADELLDEGEKVWGGASGVVGSGAVWAGSGVGGGWQVMDTVAPMQCVIRPGGGWVWSGLGQDSGQCGGRDEWSVDGSHEG